MEVFICPHSLTLPVFGFKEYFQMTEVHAVPLKKKSDENVFGKLPQGVLCIYGGFFFGREINVT